MTSYIDDILDSRRRALVRQGWLFGELMNRIGNPFKWVDGDQMDGLGAVPGSLAVLQYLAMSGEIYETPPSIRTEDHDHVYNDLRDRLSKICRIFAPFDLPADWDFDNYVKSTSSVKTQDYCAIRTLCPDLANKPVHLDIGPGLGANSLYSIHHLGASYIAVDAHPVSYSVQRLFFRSVVSPEADYLDTIDCESFGLELTDIEAEIAKSQHKIRHVPSWHWGLIGDQSVDLVSATWVLNEVTPAGIAWFLFQLSRVLKCGAYCYIRDSHRRKPNRHSLDYDAALLQMGFEEAASLDIKNRIDMHGVPRAYRKTRHTVKTFADCFEDLFGRFVISAHGGDFAQDGDPDKN